MDATPNTFEISFIIACLSRLLSHEDKTFVALYAHAVEFFEKLLDTFNKHPFEIRFIHSLQCYFAASDYKNMFIIHLSDHLYY